MSKRFMISVNDDFYLWLTAEAENIGIPSATMATILLNEAKKNREAQANIQMTNDKMKEQVTKLFEAGLQSEIKKNAEKQESEADRNKKAHETQIASEKMKEQFAKLFEESFKKSINPEDDE